MLLDSPNAVATATQQHPRPLPRATHHHHHQASGPAAATNAESIPCPRCDSKSTKFCYYNNYNLSQPRHFCKSCRRYWTHGGTLRNVPVGGGSRKSVSANPPSCTSNKRPRCSPATVSTSFSSSASSGLIDGVPQTQTAGLTGVKEPSHGIGCSGPGLGYSSLLSAPGSNTFLALGGYGPGYVPALDGIGFGFSRGVWPFPDAAGLADGASYGGFRGPILGPAGVDAWNMGGSLNNPGREGEGLMDGESFPWPELAISMPGQGLK